MKNKIYKIAMVGLLTVGFAWKFAAAAVDPAMDPIKVGPNNYKSIFENDRVRALEVTFKPGEKIMMHSHPDHFAYALTDGMLKITSSEGKAVDVVAKQGQLFWMDAQSHAAENPGKTEFRLLVVELKEPKAMMKMEPAKAAPMKTEPMKAEPAKMAPKTK